MSGEKEKDVDPRKGITESEFMEFAQAKIEQYEIVDGKVLAWELLRWFSHRGVFK